MRNCTGCRSSYEGLHLYNVVQAMVVRYQEQRRATPTATCLMRFEHNTMAAQTKRPNFLIIVADDLGYSDIAPYGGEISTPNLTKMAEEGIRLTNFHTASACSPTRSMLFSGTDNHIAGLGQMAEYMRRDPSHYANRPGYEGYLNWRVAALSEILQDADYHTVMSGKWHLGFTKDLAPCARGFDRNFTFLPGSGNHYAYEPQLAPGTPCPPCVNTKDFWMEGERFIDMFKDLPKDFYSTTSFTDRLIGYLEERSGDDELREKPFFAYLPFTAPHWPLQAPREVIKKYGESSMSCRCTRGAVC